MTEAEMLAHAEAHARAVEFVARELCRKDGQDPDALLWSDGEFPEILGVKWAIEYKAQASELLFLAARAQYHAKENG